MLLPFLLTCLGGVGFLYLYHLNRGLKWVPEEARRLSPRRWTVDEIKAAHEKAIHSPVDVSKSLPPRQNRRYVVIGGSGLVGNWVVTHLLARGENPAAIRVLDLQAPRRETLDQGVAFVQTNIVDESAVLSAFLQAWSPTVADLPLTVFHNAAAIRPAERHKAFLPLCRNVNVGGTANVLKAAKRAGASCLVATSSGSVTIRPPSYWLTPWTQTPKYLAQVMRDSDQLPKEHNEFFSNYAATKAEAEGMIRGADDLTSNFRTGCIRPTNGIYGVGVDNSATIVGHYLRIGGAPSWLYDVIQSFVNAENVSIGHLLYEQRLIEHTKHSDQLPDIGGQAFIVTDPNPAITFGDLYLLLTTLVKTPMSFPVVPAVPFFLISYMVEWYALLQHLYLPWLPKVKRDLAQLQPGLFSISNVHVIADDSRARLSPEQGGLGYSAPITTLEGMCKEVDEWNRKADQKTADAIAEKPLFEISRDGVDVNLALPEKKI
ncbi:putative 3-beta hydroxysteroid dehydrogenase/isomerase family protein [Aspergillus affinis]|uniref:putative 3-beta hydroxysteroid dehydrogenase/isomerase family protein n=1 Tax=Aspergillus affinis TaxID=1070780 RepID=UPI0022FDBAD5|nr:NAD(P)-binding protein [Aspergillus affinis]KAI9045797.1 NAD(P)-binding protein [Aspergillus affinis]